MYLPIKNVYSCLALYMTLGDELFKVACVNCFWGAWSFRKVPFPGVRIRTPAYAVNRLRFLTYTPEKVWLPTSSLAKVITGSP